MRRKSASLGLTIPMLFLSAALGPQTTVGAQEGSVDTQPVEILLLEDLAGRSTVTLGEALDLVLLASGADGDALALSPLGKASDEVASLGDLSYLLLEAFDIPAGIGYAVFPGSRYAFRELRFRRIILGDVYEYAPITGRELVDLVARVALDWAGPGQPVARGAR